ncbi:MAG: phospho-sugar mutase, partial [Verrucomicrobiae bacterium]|nr:phospho-sugar mutase [Verrucomicrobiae bacterium]
DLIPKEKMLFVDLADGRAFAVRPSGTEPKIKFYFYQRPRPGTDPAISPADLEVAKAAGDAAYESLSAAVIADLRERIARL